MYCSEVAQAETQKYNKKRSMKNFRKMNFTPFTQASCRENSDYVWISALLSRNGTDLMKHLFAIQQCSSSIKLGKAETCQEKWADGKHKAVMLHAVTILGPTETVIPTEHLRVLGYRYLPESLRSTDTEFKLPLPIYVQALCFWQGLAQNIL